jgi:LacI family transcriptional regulator
METFPGQWKWHTEIEYCNFCHSIHLIIYIETQTSLTWKRFQTIITRSGGVMATIKDIARLAGVGLGTVSRVINGSSQVRPGTAEKVLAVARELNYRPNAAARALVKGDYTRHTLGVALPVAVHPFYMEIVKGIYEAVAQKNYNLLIFNLGQEAEAVYEHILQESLPGLLVVAQALPETSRNMLIQHQIPFCYIDYYSNTDSSFYINNDQGGILAARHFIDKGYTKISYIGENAHTQQQDQRFGGFKQELERANIQLLSDTRIPINDNDCYNTTMDILKKHQPEAIFYFCDELAYGGLRAVREQDTTTHIMGYDDRDASQYLELNTISQPASEMGYQAALTMIEHLDSSSPALIQKDFDPRLIIRKT